MFRQNLLVLSIVLICLAGCHRHHRHHRHHPHACRQPGLAGWRRHDHEHHHRQCRICGCQSDIPGDCTSPLFPGDTCGLYDQSGGCGGGIGCSTCQSCNAGPIAFSNSCDGCGWTAAGIPSISGAACHGCGAQIHPSLTPSFAPEGCSCGQQQAPAHPPQHFIPQSTTPPSGGGPISAEGVDIPAVVPSTPQENATPSHSDPPLPIDATPPQDTAPATLPPVDPVSWRIPAVTP